MARAEHVRGQHSTLPLSPGFPVRSLLARVNHFRCGGAVGVHLPTVAKCRRLDGRGATLGGGEVIFLVTVEVSTEPFHL